MTEFDLISRLQETFNESPEHYPWPAVLGIGDDGAVLEVPGGMQLVVSTDTLVSGVHFLETTQAEDIAGKALAVNLSDLAAMGARPAWFFLSVTLPERQPDWWDAFSRGLLEVARSVSIQLAGGDTTQGPLSITVTAMGLVPAGSGLRRSGARPGDLVFVSGVPGLAALALHQRQLGEIEHPDAKKALDRPQARLALAQALLGKASSCIDISDGLAADLGHVLKASECGAELQLSRLPTSEALSGLSDLDRWHFQLAGGDDYELCFTLSPDDAIKLAEIEKQAGVKLTQIGQITENKGLELKQPNGDRLLLSRSGYEHFS